MEQNWDKSPLSQETNTQEISNLRERNRRFYGSAFLLQSVRLETLQIPTIATHSLSPALRLSGQGRGVRTSPLPHTFCTRLISLAGTESYSGEERVYLA